jgi:Bifunctional DNA primase/polymerase, N-terminal
MGGHDRHARPAVPPWVLTGSGRLHYYVAWESDLPARIIWQGEILGEIQRGPGQQQVVLPPSVHPETGDPYRWISDDLRS